MDMVHIHIYILSSSAALRAALILPGSSEQISGVITVPENQTDRNKHKQRALQHTHTLESVEAGLVDQVGTS